MSDSSLAPEIHKRIVKLEKLASHKDNSRQQILDEILVIKNFLVDDISVIQHCCLWGYLGYLFSSYGDQYANLSDFVDDMLRLTGYCKTTTTQAIIQGEKVILKKYKPDSLSYSNCGKKKRGKILEAIIELSFNKWKIKFDDWFKEYNKNPELI